MRRRGRSGLDQSRWRCRPLRRCGNRDGRGYRAILLEQASDGTTIELARQKVRLDLFDRRNAIYQRYRNSQSKMSNEREHETIANEAVSIYLDSVFLFQRPGIEFLHSFVEDTREYSQLNIELRSTTIFYDETQRKDLANQKSEVRRRIFTSVHKAEDVFRPAIVIDFY